MKTLFKLTLCLALVFQLGQAYAQCNFDGTLTMTSGCNGNNTVTLRICAAPYPGQFDTYQLVGTNQTYVGTYGAVGGACSVMVTWRGVADGTYTYKLNTNAPCSNHTVTVTSVPATGAITLNASRSPQICQGESITLTAAGGTDYHWSSSAGDSWNGGTSISVSPQVSTTYTVTGTPFGCSAPGSETKSIPVSVTPTVGPVAITSGTYERCQGAGQSTFVGSTATNALTYGWTLSPEEAGSITAGGVATWSASFSGTASVTYTANGCGTSSDTKSVTIDPPPSATLSPSGVVQVPLGTFQTDLTAPLNSTYTYKWSSDAVDYSWVTGNVFTAKESGLYKVKITTPQGCSATSAATRVIISKDRNYIIERNVQIDKKTNGQPVEEADVPLLAIGAKTENYTFFDGIGRPQQTVATGASPGHMDAVQPIAYDVYGRETVKYLPYTSAQSPGWFKENALGTGGDYAGSEQYDFYQQPNSTIAQDEPYAKTTVEISPLNRVLKQGAPGAAWQPNNDDYSLEDKTIKKGYWNNAPEEVLFFTYDLQADILSAGDAPSFDYYDANTLTANKTTDENKNEVIEFIDKQGRTVCKKVQSGTQNGVKQYACTYYIYDDKDQLILVLPPEAIVEILKQH
ncbi:DUF6443 domain-containing protein [Chryseolinea serpens]|nr:DUF6443 domain-containing protein [Chryseolinea serpens]